MAGSFSFSELLTSSEFGRGSISSDWALPGDGDGIINATKAHVFTRLETEFEASCHCI